MGPFPAPGLGDLGILDATIHTFGAALQAWRRQEGARAPPPPSTIPQAGMIAALSILHLRFAYEVAGDADLPPI